MNVVTVVDYGAGNLLSVTRAFEHCGADVSVTDSPSAIEKAERLVLPGVGAFADGMRGLNERGLVEPIRRFASTGRPFLGICLGMQMMLDSSEEFGYHEGLGLIPGKNVAIPDTGTDGKKHKIPHIGWNEIALPAGLSWENSVLTGIKERSAFYFVHSFMAVPSKAENRLADCDYDGRVISSVIMSGSLYGCQFHPEKSGETGLKVIRNFLRLGLAPRA